MLSLMEKWALSEEHLSFLNEKERENFIALWGGNGSRDQKII